MSSNVIHLGNITVAVGNEVYFIGYMNGVLILTDNSLAQSIDWSYNPNNGQFIANNPPISGQPLMVVAGDQPGSGSDVVFWDNTAEWSSWIISGNTIDGYLIQLTSYPALYLSAWNVSAPATQQLQVTDLLTMQTIGDYYYVFQFSDTPGLPIPLPPCPQCPPPSPPCPPCPGGGGGTTTNCVVPILITSGVALAVIIIIIIVTVILLRRRRGL